MRWPVHITTARAGREARGVVAPGGPTSGPWRPLRDCRQRRRCRPPSAAAAATAAAAASPHRLWGESASGPVGVFLCALPGRLLRRLDPAAPCCPFPPLRARARGRCCGSASLRRSPSPPPPPPQWVPSSRLGGGGPPSRTHFVCPSLLPVRLGHQRGATPCGCTPRLSAACRSTLCPSARALVPRIVWAHPRPPPYLCSVRQVWEEPRGGAATESVRWTVGTAYRTALHVCGEGKAGRPRAAPTYRLRGCAVGLLVGVGVWAVRSGLAPLEVGTHPRRAVRLTDTVSRAAAAKSGEGAAHRCRPSCAAVFALAGKRTYTGAVRSPSTVAVAPVRVCVLRVASRGDLAF